MALFRLASGLRSRYAFITYRSRSTLNLKTFGGFTRTSLSSQARKDTADTSHDASCRVRPFDIILQRSRTHVVFRCGHSSSDTSCHDSRPDLVSLGSVEHVRVDDPLCRRLLGLVSSCEHSRLLYPCGLVVGSSDFQIPNPELHHCGGYETHRLHQKPLSRRVDKTYSSHCMLILIAFLPVAESNRVWVNGKGIV